MVALVLVVGACTSPPLATESGAVRDDIRNDFDDTPFDYSNPANLGDWAPSRYGPDDQRGAFNEVTPEKTAAALAVLGSRPEVRMYNLGELM
jgi:hypothetical protein